ncbi:MAG TPA: hypothetical protein VF044_08785 [Actinomycetota bacterium]
MHEAAPAIAHLELRTHDAARAEAFLRELFGWRSETIRLAGQAYVALAVGGRIDGGIAEAARPPSWLPYVEVTDIDALVDRARSLGAGVALPVREGPAGWRCVLVTEATGEVALWQPKR